MSGALKSLRVIDVSRFIAGPRADILIENFRPVTMEKMGCGWTELSRTNPRLIMTRIPGFGQDGPYADRPCFDVIAQEMSGLMEIMGQPDAPTMAGSFVVDFLTAPYATIRTLTKLHARDRTGQGSLSRQPFWKVQPAH